MNRLQEKYKKELTPILRKKFDYGNDLAVPKVVKVVINVGTGPGLKDAKFNEVVAATLERISGQKPVRVAAKKSISNFKIRAGLIVGMMVTLRGKRMYDFVEKLINITLPRIRDFRGLETKMVDPNGNLNIGFREHIAFPEIRSDEVEKIHGLQVSVVTDAKSHDIGLELFKLLGFPFRQ
ncbi:MAG TPA: 50S ribosomal protein L5 [Patescibacteria group bacterium]|nr:50S ribosomal protein L5 [Patescibacteria group bacterium]